MNNSILKVMMAGAVALCAMVVAAEMPRSEWQAKVGDCAQNPELLKQTIGQLSSADQLLFVSEVNKAISKMPGSDDVKGARFYAANRAAVTGSINGNRGPVLAEVFATVPPEFLTVINERFASELFNRNANPSRTFTDEEFTNLSTNTMNVIIKRCGETQEPSVRSMFAVLMFVRASNGTPEGLANTLIDMFPNEKDREVAKNEWYKPAMGIDQVKSYDPMLGSAGAGEEPDHHVVLRLTGIQSGVELLSDLQFIEDAPKVSSSGVGRGIFVNDIGLTTMPDTGVNRIPRPAISNPDSPYYSKKRGDKVDGGSASSPDFDSGSDPTPPIEPDPYRGQRIRLF